MKSNERKYLSKVADLGCLICGSPAEIHHPRFGQGLAQRAPHWLAIPLCPDHHRGNADISIHGSPEAFKNFYGDELKLLAMTIERLNR